MTWIGFIPSTTSSDGDITGVTAGSGMTGGGTTGAVTLNLIGGDGITANANDMAITAAQTTITSVLNASLVIGRDADNDIDFATDNQIIFRVGGGDNVIFKASGEIEATSLDISGDADIDGTMEADAITLGGVTVLAAVDEDNMASDSSALVPTQQSVKAYVDANAGGSISGNTFATDLKIGRDADNLIDFTTDNEITFRVSAGDGVVFKASGEIEATKFDGALEGNADTATVATTVTITDNESTDETNAVIFTAGGAKTGGNLGLESDGDLTYNPSSGTLAATAFTGNLTGDASGSAGTVTSIGNLTGDVTSSNRATTIAASAVHHSMLNDDIISGQGAMTTVDQADLLMVDDGPGTVKKITFSNFEDEIFGNVSGDGSIAAGGALTVTQSAGDFTVTGDLTVSGDTITANVGTLDVEDKNITLNKSAGDSSSTADGAGITIQDAVDASNDASILWTASSDTFTFSHAINANVTGNVTGNVSGTAATVTTAAQSNITSLGTLTTLSVDNITINGNEISSTDTNGNIDLDPHGSGKVVFHGNATKGAGQFVLNCEANSHGITIKGPPHSASASYTLTLPNNDGDADQVLKTDGSGNLAWVAQTSPGGAGDMTQFYLEDDDGTEVTIDNNKEVKFIGSGITTNWTDTSTGNDGDPYDLTFTVDAAQTGITSVLNASLTVGRDAHNQIDFSTDNEIHFKTNNETPVIKMKASGEIEATKFDGALEGNADTATALATTRALQVTLSETDSSNFDGTAAVTDIGVTGTLAVGNGGTGVTSMTNLKNALDDETWTFANNVTLAGFVLDGNTITGVDDSGEFTNDDAHIMTSAGIEDKILGYSYITASSSDTLSNKTIAISQVTELSNLTADEGAQLENIGTTTISATQWGYLGAASGAITNSDTVDMGDGFVIEDDDGTEVTITENKEIKFIGSGITTNWTDTDNGTDGDPYDLTFTVDAAQTGITSLLATNIKIGEDDQTKIDFETADTINFYAGNEKQLVLTDGALTPGTNAILDLGTDALEFKDGYFDGTLEADAITVGGTALNTVIAGVTVTNATNATNSSHVLVTDNESTNEENLITFVEGATSSTGNVGLEMDGHLTYNPSTGTVTSTIFKGNIDAVDGDFDGTLEADAITVGGTALNTVIAGVTVANATTAAVATTVTITDNESTNENNPIVFVAGGDLDGGNLGLESDGTTHYNPSTGTITATVFKGNIDAVDGDFDGTLEVDNLTIGGAQGSDGQVLTSTGSGVGWEDAAGGGSVSGNTFATDLKIGRDADNLIDFTTDNQVTFRVSAGDGVVMKASGEIEATSLDISGASAFDGNITLPSDTQIHFGHTTNMIEGASSGEYLMLFGKGGMFFRIGLSTKLFLDGNNFEFSVPAIPATSDGVALGSATKMWSDLFLASGSVVNFNNGDVTLTHSSNTLTVGGGNLDTNRQLNVTSSTHFEAKGDIVYLGGGSTTQGELCYLKADGEWAATDADAVATSGGVLLALALGTDPDADGMLLRGMFTLDHDPGTIADELYVSTTAGDITGTAPSGSGDIVRVVGYCLDSTNGQIWFNPSNDFIVLA